MAKYEIRAEKNLDTKRNEYHVFENGQFFITCPSLKSAQRCIAICKEENAKKMRKPKITWLKVNA